MNKQVIYMAGLPRSGSTLLCNILAQNPNIHTTPTSGLIELVAPVQAGWSQIVTHKASSLGDSQNKNRVIKGIVENYHDTDRPIVIDKNRGWTGLLELLTSLDDNTKVICPVRDVASIVASFEKLNRKNAKEKQLSAPTVEQRANQVLAGEGVVGSAYNSLKDALQRGFGDRIILVEYDGLTHNPKETLDSIYEIMDWGKFEHDFENVEQYTVEDDSHHGFTNDLHTIRQEVKPQINDSVKILGQELTHKLSGQEFWRKN